MTLMQYGTNSSFSCHRGICRVAKSIVNIHFLYAKKKSPFPLPSSLSLGVFEDRRSAFAHGPIKYFNSTLY